jgi:molecular chaperone GrpE
MAELENSKDITSDKTDNSKLGKDDGLAQGGDLMQELEPKEDISEDVLKLKQQLEDANSLAKERLEQLKRCKADLDNTLKIAARERKEQARYASEKLVCKLLCVLDSLEQASKHDEGSNVLYHQLLDILKSEGLAPIDVIGKKFDPYKHEALMQVESDEAEDGSIAQEIQKGYTLNSKVIRFSKVAVAKR